LLGPDSTVASGGDQQVRAGRPDQDGGTQFERAGGTQYTLRPTKSGLPKHDRAVAAADDQATGRATTPRERRDRLRPQCGAVRTSVSTADVTNGPNRPSPTAQYGAIADAHRHDRRHAIAASLAIIGPTSVHISGASRAGC
jgi:hypothetical protein